MNLLITVCSARTLSERDKRELDICAQAFADDADSMVSDGKSVCVELRYQEPTSVKPVFYNVESQGG